jgi:5'-deoxynucleotidase YfbR-like HD superfamily hydrolase
LKLALVHDLAECIVGDITPYCGVTPAEKRQREDIAMKELAQLAGSCGTELYSLYKVKAYSGSHNIYICSSWWVLICRNFRLNV